MVVVEGPCIQKIWMARVPPAATAAVVGDTYPPVSTILSQSVQALLLKSDPGSLQTPHDPSNRVEETYPQHGKGLPEAATGHRTARHPSFWRQELNCLKPHLGDRRWKCWNALHLECAANSSCVFCRGVFGGCMCMCFCVCEYGIYIYIKYKNYASA